MDLRTSSRVTHESQGDLIAEEYEGYISVLTFRISQFITQWPNFPWPIDCFMPDVKLPTSLFIETGLIQFLTGIVTTPGVSEFVLSKSCILLAKMIYFTDSLTDEIPESVIVALTSRITESPQLQRQIVILLNNILCERTDWIPSLIPVFQACLENFALFQKISSNELSLLARFEPFITECEVFSTFCVNTVNLMRCEWEEDDLVMILLLLKMCSDDSVSMTSYLVENDVHVKLCLILMSHNNPGILESALFVIKHCVERVGLLLGDDVLARVCDIAMGIEEGDVEALRDLCLEVIHLSINVRGGSTPDELDKIIEIAGTCAFDGICEAVRIIAAQMFKEGVDEQRMKRWFRFVIENGDEMPGVVFPAIVSLRNFLELHGNLRVYQSMYTELGIEAFVLRQLEILDDEDELVDCGSNILETSKD